MIECWEIWGSYRPSLFRELPLRIEVKVKQVLQGFRYFLFTDRRREGRRNHSKPGE